MKIYIIGNSLVPKDRLPLQYMDELKKKFPRIRFLHADPNENFPPKGEKNIVIVDTIQGITRPAMFDLDDLEKTKKTPLSPHDYDLGMHLILLKKIRRIDSVIIFGVPQNREKTTLRQLIGLIEAFFRST